MGQYKQSERLLELATPLGPDILLARSFSCTERISGLYSVDVWACAESVDAPSVKAESLIGQRAFIRLAAKDGQHRFFHGIVRRFTFTGKDDEFHHYRLEIVPFAWRLSQVTNCRPQRTAWCGTSRCRRSSGTSMTSSPSFASSRMKMMAARCSSPTSRRETCTRPTPAGPISSFTGSASTMRPFTVLATGVRSALTGSKLCTAPDRGHDGTR